jgi:hypothetical protein
VAGEHHRIATRPPAEAGALPGRAAWPPDMKLGVAT